VKKSGKTVNNILSVLNVLVKVAHDWAVIDHGPCAVKVVRSGEPGARGASGEAARTSG